MPSDAPEPGHPATQPEIIASLKKSSLILEADHLTKRDADGIVSRHSLDSIIKVGVVRQFEPVAITLAVAAVAVAGAAKWLLASPGWSWTVFAVLMFVALFFIFGSSGPRLLIESRHGEVRYQLLDADDDVDGFVLTVAERLESKP